jgi:hypothetical protein
MAAAARILARTASLPDPEGETRRTTRSSPTSAEVAVEPSSSGNTGELPISGNIGVPHAPATSRARGCRGRRS